MAKRILVSVLLLCIANGEGLAYNAAIMLSSTQTHFCGNQNEQAITRLNVAGHPMTYVETGVGLFSMPTGCVVIPVKAPIGSVIRISGITQTMQSVPNAPAKQPLTPCFNTEAFSVGLAGTPHPRMDPQDPANLNPEGFGFMWFTNEMDLKPGPYKYQVVGCGPGGCPTHATYFNTDNSVNTNVCQLLPALR